MDLESACLSLIAVVSVNSLQWPILGEIAVPISTAGGLFGR